MAHYNELGKLIIFILGSGCTECIEYNAYGTMHLIEYVEYNAWNSMHRIQCIESHWRREKKLAITARFNLAIF